MITRTIAYTFHLKALLAVSQSGFTKSRQPRQTFVPAWIGLLPTAARPSQEMLDDAWRQKTRMDARSQVPTNLNAQVHYGLLFQLVCDDFIDSFEVADETKFTWPEWYREGVRSGAIAKWDDDRIQQDVSKLAEEI